MSSRLAFPGCILGRGYSSCAGDQPSQPKPHLGLPPFGRHKEEMVPSGNRQADIIQAGSRKQKGGEGLLRVVLVQSLVDEADRKDLWERESEVGGGPRLTAEGWGCPSWAVIPLSWTPLTIGLFLDLGVDLAHCSL